MVSSSRQNIFPRIKKKIRLNTIRPTACFMTILDYVDSDDLVWRLRWFDSTSAAARTSNVRQCVVMVHDTSSLNPETATIHCLVTHRVHLQCRRQSLNLGAQRPLRRRCVGWDESLLMNPKGRNLSPGMVPPIRYTSVVWIVTLRKTNFCPEVCFVVSGSCKL